MDFIQWRRQIKVNYAIPNAKNIGGVVRSNIFLIKNKKIIRKFTPRKGTRLQDFSDNFIFPSNLAKSNLYKQIDNSINIPVIEKISF